MKTIFQSTRVVTGGAVRPAAIYVENGLITDVTAPGPAPEGWTLIDAGERVILPGVVDTHVHVNEPGRTEWEGFETATRAAAAGGVTTLVDMPLNSLPPTTTLEALIRKTEAARDKVSVDVGFWGGVVPGNVDQIRPLVDAGVLGFKSFLIDSGVDEFPPVGEVDLRPSLNVLAELGAPLLVHAELAGPIAAVARTLPGLDRRSYRYHLQSRPRAAENEAIELMIRLCRELRTHVHIVHHCSADALRMLDAARDEGLPLTVETCPHYLSFAAEEIPDGATWFKCTPPIREADNREQLWDALRAGVIDSVVSDHSPSTPSLKHIEDGDFENAWGGISSLELALSATWTEAARRGFGLPDLSRWMSEAPAALAGLSHLKGRIARGLKADLVMFDPSDSFVVEPHALHHRHPITPYQGRELKGRVEATYLGGELIFSRERGLSTPRGRLLIGERR